MADLATNTFPDYAPRGETMSFQIADGVTLYPGALVGLEGGYLNHWAEGAADLFAGVFVGGDDRATAGVFIGETSDARPPEGRVLTGGVTLKHLSSVVGSAGGAIAATDVGLPVYGSTSNTDDLTMDPSGSVHVIGFLSRFRSATDVDVTLLSIGEARAHATA